MSFFVFVFQNVCIESDYNQALLQKVCTALWQKYSPISLSDGHRFVCENQGVEERAK